MRSNRVRVSLERQNTHGCFQVDGRAAPTPELSHKRTATCTDARAESQMHGNLHVRGDTSALKARRSQLREDSRRARANGTTPPALGVDRSGGG